MNPLRLVFVEPKGGGKIQDGVTVTPTKEEQTVEPDPGFDGLGEVTVEAIPDVYQDVTGVNAGAEDIRVGKVGIDAQGNLLNGEMLPRKPEQEKSVVPTKQAQTVEPDSGYALFAVNVAKIPDAYQDVSFVDAEAADIRVGKTGVSSTGERLDGQMLPQKPEQTKSVTPTESSQLVEPDAGYALSAVEVDAIPSEYADISGVTAVANVVKSGYVFVDSEGVETQGTNTDDADTSDGTMSASQLEAGEVGYSQGQRIVGKKPIRTADVEIDSLSPVPIPAGSYDGTVKARLADPTEVDAQYILQNHSILGVQGQAEAKVDPAKGLVFDDYDADGFPATARFVGTWTDIDRICQGAFAYYSIGKKVEEITVPNGVTELAGGSFQWTRNLKRILLPDTLTKINGTYTFYECSANITVPASFTEFGSTQQFAHYLGHEVVFEGHVPNIPRGCFYQQVSLVLLDLSHCTSIPSLYDSASISNTANLTIRIPLALSDQTLGTGNGWESATNWSGLVGVTWEVV